MEGGSLCNGCVSLFAEEEALVANAVGSRRTEFRCGRMYAHRALAQLGCASSPIGCDRWRAPVWPPDVIGSITHSQRVCAVAVARESEVISLGIDIETAEPLGADITQMIASTAELRDRHHIEHATGVDLPKLLFAIKECVYKAYFPKVRAFLEFSDVTVGVEAGSLQFRASIARCKPPLVHRHEIAGRFAVLCDHVIAYSDVRARSSCVTPIPGRLVSPCSPHS